VSLKKESSSWRPVITVSVLFFILSYLAINILAIGQADLMAVDDSQSRLKVSSLYDKTAETYYKRIHEARSRFKLKLSINEPCYVVTFGRENINASYSTLHKCVFFTERAVRDLNMDELTGVTAHEFAHAEEVEILGAETRPHWMIDVRAAQNCRQVRNNLPDYKI